MKIRKKIIVLALALIASIVAEAQSPLVETVMTKKQRAIVSVASLTATSGVDSLKTSLARSLDEGMTVNELKEVLVHTYAYCGFPRALRGLQTLVSVLDERKAKGIDDNYGREATPVSDTRSKYERGRDILAKVSGAPKDSPKAAYAKLSPEIERFLKEHLFCDLFERDVLTYQDRELATVAVIASLGSGVEPMLRSHIGVALNTGVTSNVLRGAFSIIEKSIGRSQADAGREILNNIIGDKGLAADDDTPKQTLENGVTVQKKLFHNRFLIDIAADMYFPAGYDSTKQYAAIIVAHPFGGVKEQTAGLHARKLAERGFVTLAFDASYQGESGGYPRRIEAPEIRVEDFSAAVDFLSNYPSVDKDKIGVIGICGGGCYSVSATQIDHRIKALATISMYDMGRARRQGVGDTQTYEQRMAVLDEIGRQRTAEYGGAERKDIRALPVKVDENTPEYARQFIDYYDNPARGQHARSTGWYSYTSLAPMMNFFPFAQVETISPRPVLFIAGEKAVSKYFSEDAYNRAAEPKELFIVPNATHVDLYDQPQYLDTTLPKLETFFKTYLK